MRIALFCHSLLSDWNHGNAHFLRGLAAELDAREHDVRVFEPREAWSVKGLVASEGTRPLDEVRRIYPSLSPVRYDEDTLDLDRALDGVSLVLVHEWSSPSLVRRIGEHRASHDDYLLFFHDTHHRALTDPDALSRLDLSRYDGVLAFGRAVRDIYLARGWARRAFVLHEAACVRVFFPRREITPRCDLVWIGNGGDGERTAELDEMLIRPIRDLGLKARFYGVRYAPETLAALEKAGIEHRGYLPNYRVPEALAEGRFTVHVPRQPYAEKLPGIPTIRVFEALACGVPLICAPWTDAEGLFSPGHDYLVARTSEEMKRHMRALLAEPALAREMADRGLLSVLARHTCAHRATELLEIAKGLGLRVEGARS
jgi:spore maturation protein CgeB